MRSLGPISWVLSPMYGVWWVGFGRARLMLKSPKNPPLFSERHGLDRYVRLGGSGAGWRVRWFKITPPPNADNAKAEEG